MHCRLDGPSETAVRSVPDYNERIVSSMFPSAKLKKGRSCSSTHELLEEEGVEEA